MDAIKTWRSAASLILQYKSAAAEVAAMRAWRARDLGDSIGFEHWRQIGSAIIALEKPRADRAMN